MRALLNILFGAACGVVATVLVMTLLPSPSGGNGDEAGGGNARLAFDEDALAAMVTKELLSFPALSGVRAVSVTVQETGLVDVRLVTGPTTQSTFSVDPEIVDGRLKMELRAAAPGDLASFVGAAALLEIPLAARVEALADGFDYRLVAIQTTHHRLTLEVAVHD
ncbi:MAG: hypothetical protein HY875_10345 [Chloroflexi bacterium]|nr:hypothetical protein [Chloroflexota bacterium]